MMLSLVLVAISLVFYSISQLQLQGKLSYNYTGFWGEKSWELKYKEGEDGTFQKPKDNLYYKLFNIKWEERFLGSTTIFVSLTDGYHLLQMLFFKTLLISIALLFQNFWITFIILCLIQSIVMNLTFRIASK